MRKLILVVLSIILYSALYGQNRIYSGKVIDEKYGTPIAYAAVYIESSRYGAVADNVGDFSFTSPDSLVNIQIVIAREGYKIKYLPLTLKEYAGIELSNLLIGLEPDDFEQRVEEMQDSIAAEYGRLNIFLRRATNVIKNDWIPLGNPKTNKFDFGRIQTFPTYNPIEGFRLRAGVASNSRLSPHLFMKGYAAYGFGDQKFKYRGEATWSFDEKAYHEDEFPKNNLSVIYEYDIFSPGEMHPRSPNNLLLITFRRSDNEATYRNFAEFNWEREYKNGLAHSAWIRKAGMVPQGDLSFESQVDDRLLVEDALNTTEAGLQLRYSVREAYNQQKRKRKPIELSSLVFFLSHTFGNYEYFGEKIPWHRSEFSAQKRFLLGTAGRLDVVGNVMKVWNSVPFPLLVYPNQRLRHNIENNAFFLNRALEFVADEQFTLRTTFVGDDLLLAKIPFLNFFQLRELISFRLSYGRLSDKNQPDNADANMSAIFSDKLYNFPEFSHEYGSAPYIEGTIGITNILGLLRVEYVHRFTYRDHPDAILGTIRVDVTL